MDKILYVIDTLQTGGAEKSLLEITSRFTSFKPIVCTLFTKQSDLKQAFIDNGIEVIELDLKGRLWLLDGVRKLRALVEDVKPKIVHSCLFKAEIVSRLAINNKKIKHIGSFVNDSYAAERYRQQSVTENIKLDIVRFLDAVTAQRVDEFVSITNSITKSNRDALRLKNKKVKVIYRGRSIENYIINHPGTQTKPFLFLTVARLLKRKGLADLIHAAKYIREIGYEFKVLLAGEGHDRVFLESLVKRYELEPTVEFLGNCNNVPALLAKSHCFVFPSHYEGQGGALIEAMLSAKPIVATRIPVFEEQIEEDKSGLLFTIFDSKDLACKMIWVMNNYDKAVTMGLYAREVAVERFDIEKISHQYEKYYEGLISQSKVVDVV